MPDAGQGSLVGRATELAELGLALDAALAGAGAVRLVCGEPGIGKTRLADEVGARAAARGFVVAWGRAWEAGGAPPLWPWQEALGALGESGALLGTEGSEAERFRAFAAVLGRLRALGATAPLLVVLDDLHAADEATLDLALLVARGLRGARVALLVTCRDAEARARPGMAERLARVAREGRRLDLGPLDPEEVARLAAGAAPALSAAELRRVVEASEGNPLFADELARLFGQGGARAPAATTEGIRAVVVSRLALLPAPARRALEAASVLGRTFERQALETLGADATGGAVSEALALAVRAGLVAPAPGREGHFAFSHALVREAVHASLPADRRAALHHAHSLWLETVPGGPLAERAHHALLGLPAGPTDRAVALAREAATRALHMGAYVDAAALLRGALDALGPSREPALRCDLGTTLAEAQARAGLGERSRETAAQAADLARALGDPARLARAVLALGFTTTLGVVNPLLVRALREALTALADRDVGLAARLSARLASALQPAAEPAEPIALALRAVELARRDGGRETLLATLYAACSALGDLAAPEVRLPLDEESAALAASLGDLAVEQRARARLAIDLVELGRLAEADRAIGEAEAIGARLALPTYLWRPALLRSMRALMVGDFAESDRRVAEAGRHALADGGFDAGVSLELHRLGAAVVVRGRMPSHDEGILRGLEAQTGSGRTFFAAMEADAAARLGLAERLRASPLEVLLGEGAPPIPLADLQFAAALGGATAAAGSPARCAWLLERLRAEGDREVTWGMMGLVDVGPLSGTLALLAAAAGRAGEALAAFERALARSAERGLLPLEASLRAERATLLGWLGREREAAADRERAALLATSLDLEPSRVLRTREALGLAPSLAPPALGEAAPGPPGPDLTPPGLALAREGDVWAVRSGGTTFRVRHVRGLEMLATLLAHPGRPFLAIELDLPAAGVELAARARDAGEVLDPAARDAYRRRARALRDAVEEAERMGDPARASRAGEELMALEDELARGLGLGGRSRRAGSRAERSRVNVQRRLRDAIQRIAEHDPALGRYLERAVRTGASCLFDP